MKNHNYEKETFSDIVKSAKNLTDVAKKLGLNPHCGNRETIKKYIKLFELDISHFIVSYENRKKSKKSLKEIMVNNSTFNTTNLKERLYDEGLKERKCELCGQGEVWRGKKISLILDHINGVNDDHRFENLRIVCPNCDAALPTFSGRNVGSKYKEMMKDQTPIKFCRCGIEIKKQSTLCFSCQSIEQRKTERPTIDTIKNDVKELGYSGTGRKYGVSDNSIRKWLK